MPRVSAGDHETARQPDLSPEYDAPDGVGHDAVSATAALHQEVAIPCRRLRQRQSETDTELFAVNAFAPMDDAVDAAMRGQWTDGRAAGIGRRKRCAGGYLGGLRDLDAIHLETAEIGAGICRPGR